MAYEVTKCSDCWYYWFVPEVQLLSIPDAPCCVRNHPDDPPCNYAEPIDGIEITEDGKWLIPPPNYQPYLPGLERSTE